MERAGRLQRIAALCEAHGVCWPGLLHAAETMSRDPVVGNRRRFLDAVREAVTGLQARGLWPGGHPAVASWGERA